jgi:hypothetical protein
MPLEMVSHHEITQAISYNVSDVLTARSRVNQHSAEHRIIPQLPISEGFTVLVDLRKIGEPHIGQGDSVAGKRVHALHDKYSADIIRSPLLWCSYLYVVFQRT